MPCYDHRNSPSYVREEVQAEMQGKIDQLAQWLCAVLTAVEAAQGGTPLRISDPELQDWWDTHKAWDSARKEAEQEDGGE